MRRLAAAGTLAVALMCVPAMAQEGAHQQSTEHASEGGHAEDLTFWKIATFAVLAGALGYAIVKNGGPFFRGRSEEIQSGIQEARRAREEAEARAAQMESRLANLGAEVESLKATARAEAEAEGRRIRLETERDLARIQEQADQEIQSAAKAAQTALRQHAASLAVSLARQKAEFRMSDANQDSLVRDFAAGAGQNAPALKSAE